MEETRKLYYCIIAVGSKSLKEEHHLEQANTGANSPLKTKKKRGY